MVRISNLFAKVQGCHKYSLITQGNVQIPIALKCSEIVSIIRTFVSTKCSRHPRLTQQQLIAALGKDLIAMGLIRVILPDPKSYVPDKHNYWAVVKTRTPRRQRGPNTGYDW